MRFLVTRPQPDADELGERLRRLGHEAVIAPLLEIRCSDFALPAADRFDGLVVTSRNTLACLAGRKDLGTLVGLPLFAVGKATADAARAMRFAQVVEGPGRASDLVAVIAGYYAGRTGVRLFYTAAADKAFDLVPPLQKAGIEMIVATAYEALDVSVLPGEALAALGENGIDAVLLMSPRTAGVFARLVEAAGLGSEVETLACLCLSLNVAKALAGSPLTRILVADEPRLEALVELALRFRR